MHKFYNYSPSTLLFLLCKVEELLMEIKETEEEVARWREACELEVEAGKNVIEDRDKVVIVDHNNLLIAIEPVRISCFFFLVTEIKSAVISSSVHHQIVQKNIISLNQHCFSDSNANRIAIPLGCYCEEKYREEI